VPVGFPAGGIISPGDVLVSSFNDINNCQGRGTTIIKFTPNNVSEPDSVAADSETNLVYVPIRGNTAVAGSGAVCSKATDVFGLAGSDALGCILSYVAPRDGDDR
jgi:hypothetical protein